MKKRLQRCAALLSCLLLMTLLLPCSAAALQPVHAPSDAYRTGPYYQNLLSLELTGDPRTDLILVALSQLGYHEGDSESEMHGMSSAGSRNFAEYNRLHGKVDNGEGNGVSYGYYWCCAFATWCARQAGISRDLVPNEISCWRLIDRHFKPMGIYHTVSDAYTPIAGDYIFFRGEEALPGAPSDHIGIVLYVQGKTVWTVEGNSIYQSVAVRSYRLDDPYIVGYASPDYPVDADAAIDFNPETAGYRLWNANYFITATNLNVRAGAGVGHDVLGYLHYGDTVVLLEVEGNWGRIHYEGADGWISLSYVQYVPTPVTERPPSATLTLQVGSQAPEHAIYDLGTVMTLPELPERVSASPDTYRWVGQGWDADGDGVPDYTPGTTLTLQHDLTLSAVYRREPTPYTVRFFGADGVLIDEQVCPYGSRPVQPDMALHAPEDGRIFDGWDRVILSVTQDAEYHAVYLPAPEPVRYTVRFFDRDGVVIAEQQLPAGVLPVPPDTQRMLYDDGSEFLGWDEEVVPVVGDADYRAVYRYPPNEPDDPLPSEPEQERQAPPAVIVLLAAGGLLLLVGAVVFARRYAGEGAFGKRD